MAEGAEEGDRERKRGRAVEHFLFGFLCLFWCLCFLFRCRLRLCFIYMPRFLSTCPASLRLSSLLLPLLSLFTSAFRAASSVRFSFEFSHIHFISCAQARPSASCQPAVRTLPLPLSLPLSTAISLSLLLSRSTCDPLSTLQMRVNYDCSSFFKNCFSATFFRC